MLNIACQQRGASRLALSFLALKVRGLTRILINATSLGISGGILAMGVGGGIEGIAGVASKANKYKGELGSALGRVKQGARPGHDDWAKRLSDPEKKAFNAIGSKVEEIVRLNPEVINMVAFREILVSAIKSVEENRSLTSNAHQLLSMRHRPFYRNARNTPSKPPYWVEMDSAESGRAPCALHSYI